jgi:hypothetical protein
MCLNCGKTSYTIKIYHNNKRDEPAVHVVPIKVVQPVIEVYAQPIKPTRMPLMYFCIIYFSFEHCALDCPKKIKV